MTVFRHSQSDRHEAVLHCQDPASGLKAIIAIHSTKRGPALGGCRMLPYASEDAALSDALRLSRGMSYKNALAGLPCGGGKAVIIGDPRTDKTPDLLRAFGRCVDMLGGRYLTAEDSNISTPDVALMRETTRHVRRGPFDGSGDPSPVTAWGVFLGIKVGLEHRGLDVDGATVIVEGLGKVGLALAHYLHEAGATLLVSDVDGEKVAEACRRYRAEALAPGSAHRAAADVYSPNAYGATLNAVTIPEIRARVVAGGANNQLATPEDGHRLREAGILYCPDYVVNAGGVIRLHSDGEPIDVETALRRTDTIADTTRQILRAADADGIPTSEAADRIAERLLR
ncbi:Glu/Leu/Phe/Val dehydrogenase [Methylobacterium sp. BTF04]|uniref:Glu/Leu/Phe/Val dehydrogenase dimerization domain-containing protein n=1 Tax=Methylobacterium sp. BTF04 TaxID=2708300 RepID=UPI0013CFE194|nr:Glu/Leu/Phe/Val dehydrogenase [Methylobacterium sp. BTF04]